MIWDVPRPPSGYVIVDPEKWAASRPMISDPEIDEMDIGGLAIVGLAADELMRKATSGNESGANYPATSQRVRSEH